MEFNYDSAEEAQNHLNTNHHKYNGHDWFCPVIRRDCNPNCHCYREAMVVEGRSGASAMGTGKWGVSGDYCVCPLITGTVEVINGY